MPKGLFSRNRVIWILRVALTFLFVYLANRSLTGAEFGPLCALIRPSLVFLSLAAAIAGILCQVWRWQIILRYQGLSSDFRIALKTILLGNLLAFVTPGRFGELFRGLSISRERRSDTILAVMIDKLFILLATFATGIACALLQMFVLRQPVPRLVFITGGMAAGVCVALVVFLVYRRSLAEPGGMVRYVVRFVNLSPKLLTRSGRNALALSFAAHLLLILQTTVLLAMFGCGGGWRSVLAFGQAYAFMAFLPIFIANMGIREYSFALFLQSIGTGCGLDANVQSAALGASVAILLTNLILPALAGLVWTLAEAVAAKK